MTKEITLTQGKTALIDDADYEWIGKKKWCFHNGYAVRSENQHGKSKIVFMHREIVNTPPGKETDHINCNPLDNRRENLRICARSENRRNIGKLTRNTSGYKGVTWHKQREKWSAQILVGGKNISLGLYVNIEDAVRARDDAERKYYGEFARPNLPADNCHHDSLS